MVRYANRPGIIGSSEGNENTSAGQCISRANRMLKSPMQLAATNVASEISNPDFIRKKRNACPMAAKNADTKIALRDGFEITAKPMAAMAANKPSISIRRIISVVIIAFPILELTLR